MAHFLFSLQIVITRIKGSLRGKGSEESRARTNSAASTRGETERANYEKYGTLSCILYYWTILEKLVQVSCLL